MSEFLQGMLVGGGLTGGIIALGWWVLQSQRPAPRQGQQPAGPPGSPTRRKRMGT